MAWGFHGLGMLLFWGVLTAFLVWAFRPVVGRVGERRYAGGEITREEFQAIRKELQS
ncbi:MAG: SHOCT domain-containing protein [bacterium]